MHRNYKGNVMSNNSIRYNILNNKKTKNIAFIPEEDGLFKVNCYKIYDVSVSNRTKKLLNHRCKYININSDEHGIE